MNSCIMYFYDVYMTVVMTILIPLLSPPASTTIPLVTDEQCDFDAMMQMLNEDDDMQDNSQAPLQSPTEPLDNSQAPLQLPTAPLNNTQAPLKSAAPLNNSQAPRHPILSKKGLPPSFFSKIIIIFP